MFWFKTNDYNVNERCSCSSATVTVGVGVFTSLCDISEEYTVYRIKRSPAAGDRGYCGMCNNSNAVCLICN